MAQQESERAAALRLSVDGYAVFNLRFRSNPFALHLPDAREAKLEIVQARGQLHQHIRGRAGKRGTRRSRFRRREKSGAENQFPQEVCRAPPDLDDPACSLCGSPTATNAHSRRIAASTISGSGCLIE